jgi:hypothetical protein
MECKERLYSSRFLLLYIFCPAFTHSIRDPHSLNPLSFLVNISGWSETLFSCQLLAFTYTPLLALCRSENHIPSRASFSHKRPLESPPTSRHTSIFQHKNPNTTHTPCSSRLHSWPALLRSASCPHLYQSPNTAPTPHHRESLQNSSSPSHQPQPHVPVPTSHKNVQMRLTQRPLSTRPSRPTKSPLLASKLPS